MTENCKCRFCSDIGKYCCPRCGVKYCSLKCYRCEKHIQCSEGFYQEQVLDTLHDMKGSAAEKRKMFETLLKMGHNEEKNDPFSEEDLGNISDRLAYVDLDDSEKVWDLLTENERKEFQRKLELGCTDFVSLWQPWWTSSTHKSKIEDLSSPDLHHKDIDTADTCSSSRTFSKPPSIIKDIPALSCLLRNTSPDSTVKFSIVGVVLAYVYVQRLYNGDVLDAGHDGLQTFLRVCKPLSKSTVYTDLDSCLCDFNLNIQASPDLLAFLNPIDVSFHDLALVCKCEDDYVLRAVSEVHRYVRKCRKFLTKDTDTAEHKSLFLFQKKLLFYASFVVEYRIDFIELAADILATRERLMLEHREIVDQKQFIEDNISKLKPRTGALVEEIS